MLIYKYTSAGENIPHAIAAWRNTVLADRTEAHHQPNFSSADDKGKACPGLLNCHLEERFTPDGEKDKEAIHLLKSSSKQGINLKLFSHFLFFSEFDFSSDFI